MLRKDPSDYKLMSRPKMDGPLLSKTADMAYSGDFLSSAELSAQTFRTFLCESPSSRAASSENQRHHRHHALAWGTMDVWHPLDRTRPTITDSVTLSEIPAI